MTGVLGLFLVVGVALGSGGCKKSESVPIGGECSERGDCVGRNDCVKLSSGKSVCTKSCIMPRVMGPPGTPPTADECPPPTKCELVSLEVEGPSNTTEIPKIPRCLTPGAM